MKIAKFTARNKEFAMDATVYHCGPNHYEVEVNPERQLDARFDQLGPASAYAMKVAKDYQSFCEDLEWSQ